MDSDPSFYGPTVPRAHKRRLRRKDPPSVHVSSARHAHHESAVVGLPADIHQPYCLYPVHGSNGSRTARAGDTWVLHDKHFWMRTSPLQEHRNSSQEGALHGPAVETPSVFGYAVHASVLASYTLLPPHYCLKYMSLLLLFIALVAHPGPGSSTLSRSMPARSLYAADTTESDTAPVSDDALAVFIDCNTWGCDFDYFRREIPFVSYVRNREDADVHVLITAQQAGGGGRAFTLDFIGLREFEGQDATLRYTSRQTATDDDVRQALAQHIKAGLLRNLAGTPAFQHIEISYTGPEELTAATPAENPWNLWVFEIGVEGSFEGEQRTNEQSIEGSFSANRTSNAWKLDWEAEWEYDKRRFETDEGTITDIQRSGGVDALGVRSISEHWSLGGFSAASRSTFDNYNLRLNLAPALEYNVFPYSESTRQQLLFLYRIGLNSFDYRERTIFNETSQMLLRQSLNVALEVDQPWGSVRASVEGSHYLHNFDRKRLEMFSNLEFNVYGGLSIDLFGYLSLIRDQLNLPRGDAPLEDILLERRELATNYEYSVSLGLSYTFGATTNNIVNPRFGD